MCLSCSWLTCCLPAFCAGDLQVRALILQQTRMQTYESYLMAMGMPVNLLEAPPETPEAGAEGEEGDLLARITR